MVQVPRRVKRPPSPPNRFPRRPEPTGRSLEGEVGPPSIAIAPPAAQQAESQQARTALPKTASTIPLWTLAGLALLAAAALVRGIRARKAKA